MSLRAAALACLSSLPVAAQATVQNPFHPFDRFRFEAACRRLGADDEQMARFDRQGAEIGAARAADDLLRELVPAFGVAVRQHEHGDPEAAVALAQVIANAREPLLRAHARYHLARLFLDCDDPEPALQVLADYLQQDVNHSPLDAEAAFFYAQALAEMPLLEAALPRFRAFLQWFPHASERFRAAAHQRIGEIERQQQSRLHDLANGMKKTARDLKKQRTGQPTQLDQERYLEKLQQLIEEFQERESQSGGAASGLGPSMNPATQSVLPEGEGSVGNLEKRTTLADRWGDMKDADRERIAAKVQQGLTPQYQKMLEDYYRKLGKAGSRQ